MLRENPQAIHLEDYRPPRYLIDQVDLRFELGGDTTRVSSRLSMRLNPAAGDGERVLRLDGEQLELLSLRLDGRELGDGQYRQDSEGLTIAEVPERFSLETEVLIHPDANTALEGLYRSGPMLCTQCEAEGFRRITFFLDRPDVMSRFRTTLVADRATFPVLLSNGNPAGSEDLGGGRHAAVWDDPFPKPCYLFALVAGDLQRVEDHFTTASGRPVDLHIYVEPQNLDKCEHAMVSLKKAMAWDEGEYGCEYDLDVYNVVAVNDFNMGAMENKGLNIFNAKYVLARPDTATDQDFQGVEGVIAHEYFHNWTGNRITCRDWFQLSLKEGFTVFRDQEFSADMGSRGVKRIEDVRLLRAHQFAEDSGPMAHPVRPQSYIEINNFYTVTVYEKGAEVVRMQRNLLGGEAFRKATDLYFARHDGQAVTTDDFVQCMADASGRDLTQFKLWYSQAGTPELHVSGVHHPDHRTYELRVRQSCPPTPGQPRKLAMHIPLALGLIDPEGNEVPLVLEGDTAQGASTTRVLDLRQPEQVFRFIDVESRPVPSLLRGFSAPVKLRFDYSTEDLMRLIAFDSDGFNRWDAAQTLAQRILLGMVAELAAGRDPEVPAGYVEMVRRILSGRLEDTALWAEVLTLPSESYLGDQMDEVDVDGIHRCREAVRARIGQELEEELVALVRRLEETGPYQAEPGDIGRRALKNLALGYLMAGGGRMARELCLEQYRAGHNMTDVMAALRLLADSDDPERDAVLTDFEARWGNDPLVMDKWFSVQAQAGRPDTLPRVRALMHHPAFSIRNPNKVRALIGAFTANQVCFHAVDGDGYRFLLDRVLELDPLNPQVAARMLRQLARWRRYDSGRRALMQAQLQRIMDAPKVSKDVYEIASRSLEENR
jgi:aminopeptidase N